MRRRRAAPAPPGPSARWIGEVSIDAPDFPHYLIDAADVGSLRDGRLAGRTRAGKEASSSRRAQAPGFVKHHVHDFRIDLWRAGNTLVYGEYYLDDPNVLDTKRGRDALGTLLVGLPAHRKKSLGVVHVASGALALVFARLPCAAITPDEVASAARGHALRKRPLTEFDGDLALVPLAPGDYEVVVEQLGSKKAPEENEWGEFESRTVLAPR